MKKVIKYFFGVLFLFLTVLIITAVFWAARNYGIVTADELVFHIKVPLEGVDDSFLSTFFFECILVSLVITVFLLLLIFFPKKRAVTIGKRRKITLLPIRFVAKHMVSLTSLLLVGSLVFAVFRMDFESYIANQFQNSELFEKNYVDPAGATLTFPAKKKNLIYIFMESMESTYASTDEGGAESKNYIPNLTKLANQNVNFSNNDKLGGALGFAGTGWTVAGITAQTAGIPFKLPLEGNKYDENSSFLPGAYSLGQILQAQGYNQTFLLGSDAAFGARDLYFKQHGNYTIWDYYTAIKQKKISKSYHEFWGFEDKKLYSYAKDELKRLSKLDAPFNLTLLTVDTHTVDGYVCDLCKNENGSQYANVISCADRQVTAFVSWIQSQDFYKDTTIVIAGDHLSMAPNFFDNVKSFQRSTYNVFINSSVQPVNSKKRLFGTFDLFPTTLASMGVKIKGERLGIGTNLFSSKMTLAEQIGVSEFAKQLTQKSKFYEDKILYGK